jgi:lysozyme family protein
MADFQQAFLRTIIHEGGYSNDPDDSGGPTQWGISSKAYPTLDVKSLTLDDAKAIYKRDYWDAIDGDKIPDQRIAEILFDAAVNHGVAGALRMEKTVDADSTNPELFAAQFTLERIRLYHMICKRKPEQKKFLMGWIGRALNLYG